MKNVLRRLDEFYGLTDWINMEGQIHPNVPEADRKLIRILGYANAVLIFLLWVATTVLSVGFAASVL